MIVETSEYSPSSPLFADVAGEALRGGQGKWVFVDEYQARRGLIESSYERASNLVFRHIGTNLPWSYASLNRALRDRVENFAPSHVLIVKGKWVWPSTINWLKRHGVRVTNFLSDDPFNPINSSQYAVAALKLYDSLYTPRMSTLKDLSLHCPRVFYLPFAYKPSLHRPSPTERGGGWDCEASFIGGYDSDRELFLSKLVEHLPNLRLRVYGGRWDRSKQFSTLSGGVRVGAAFVQAASRSLININLVRVANRDGHTMRSYELPALGVCTVMEDTREHRELFSGFPDIFFFRDPKDLSQKVALLLNDSRLRAELANAAHQVVVNGGNTYCDRLRTILAQEATK